MSSVGGSTRAFRSPKGMALSHSLVLSLSKEAKPPFLDCMPRHQLMPRCRAAWCLAGSARPSFKATRTMELSSTSGIPVVDELEGPAPRRQIGAFDAPVSGLENLLGQQPGRGLGHGGVLRRQAGRGQGPDRQGRVPHRGDAGLQPGAVPSSRVKNSRAFRPRWMTSCSRS